MKIVATYKGSHGSCGYHCGITYVLCVTYSYMNEIIIQRQDGEGMCAYSTLTGLLNNWSDVNNLKR